MSYIDVYALASFLEPQGFKALEFGEAQPKDVAWPASGQLLTPVIWETLSGNPPPDQETIDAAPAIARDDGCLADWDGFVNSIPALELVGFMAQQKAHHPSLRDPLYDLIILIQFPTARTALFVRDFWGRLVMAVRDSGVTLPPDAVASWNTTIDQYWLPLWLKIGSGDND
jgi:hypothetical protein